MSIHQSQIRKDRQLLHQLEILSQTNQLDMDKILMKNLEIQTKNGQQILLETIGIKYGKINGKECTAKASL